MFKGRPRPQITWYKDGSNLKTFNHTEEVEKLQDSGIFKVTTTLHVPGREEFAGIYRCFGNNSLSSGWSSSKEPKYGIELLFRCKQSLSSSAANNWQFQKRRKKKATTRTTPKIITMSGYKRMQQCCNATHAARIEVSYSLPNEVLTATRGTKFLIFMLKLKFYSWVRAV